MDKRNLTDKQLDTLLDKLLADTKDPNVPFVENSSSGATESNVIYLSSAMPYTAKSIDAATEEYFRTLEKAE